MVVGSFGVGQMGMVDVLLGFLVSMADYLGSHSGNGMVLFAELLPYFNSTSAAVIGSIFSECFHWFRTQRLRRPFLLTLRAWCRC